MARQCTCFHSYYPALHYLGPPVDTKDCRRRNHHPGQNIFFELSLTRSDLPGPECQSRKTGRDSAPSRSTVACEPTQYRCGLPQSTVAASKAQKKNSMHDDNSTRDLGNGGQFLLHFQETTFGFITSREGHEKGKCNDSASRGKGKSKNRNDVITRYK